MANILVTGAAGFIGMHVCRRFLDRGDTVVGLDNLCDYYDVRLKEARLRELAAFPAFRFVKQDLADGAGIAALFAAERFDRVVNLAAQAGVRYSLDHPEAYAQANLVGFLNILEGCRHARVPHLAYASSSSVYGANRRMPFAVSHNVDHPVSLYAASKKANELMAHSYSSLYGLPTTGLRLFSVYGPWGRPDMALFIFTRAILEGRPIQVFNNGDMARDWTYVDDIAEGIVRVTDRPPEAAGDWSADAPDPARSFCPYRIYNIGRGQPVSLLRFIEILEDCLGRPAIKELLPLQPGDVPKSWADTGDLERDFGYTPATPIEDGVRRFVDWYRAYHR